jgi:hypothetical protein
MYIVEVTVLFAGHGTTKVQSRARLPGIHGRRSFWVWNGEAFGRCRDKRARVQV